jgi:hypothetical protein
MWLGGIYGAMMIELRFKKGLDYEIDGPESRNKKKQGQKERREWRS